MTKELLKLGAASALVLALAACGPETMRAVAGLQVPAAPPPPPQPTPAPGAYPPAPGTFLSTAHASMPADIRLDGTGTESRIAEVVQVGNGSVGNSGNFEYRGPDAYAFEFSGWGGPEMRPGDKVSGEGSFDRFVRVETDFITLLAISRAHLARAAPIELTYTAFGSVASIITSGSGLNDEIVYFATGMRTPAGSMPTTGTARYSGIVEGLWLDGDQRLSLDGSFMRLDADFAAGTVSTALNLQFGSGAFEDPLVLGRFTGTGTIGARASFQGAFAPKDGFTGDFAGGFHGPAANEVGFGFALKGSTGETAAGVAVGKRD